MLDVADDDYLPAVLCVPPPSSATAVGSVRADVLIVDDDLPTLRGVDRALRGLGYETFTAPCAMTALDILRTTQFSILLLDVNMPRLSGVDLARCLRAGIAGPLNANVPIIFVTSDDTATTYEETFEVSALRYVAKPVDENALSRVMDEALHR